ncbi:hypothetical protein BCR43DRAFT_565859 [Syncephalastrum racemosum]|uniref:Uncharacterized protein n=1 Tax=Syncephalastrum racemosum TaxID=13706 RepID=A0A1X2H4G1_SYNRA|nr:hypothetical protein BCR43DRAFT_565859 [Syncephalastrum racemosum]
MSSLVETSSNDDPQVSNVATMSGRPLNRNAVPKRPWNGYSLVNFTNSNGEPLTASPRLIRAPKSRTKAGPKQTSQPATGEKPTAATAAAAAAAAATTTTTGVVPEGVSRGVYTTELGNQNVEDGRAMSTKEDQDGLQEFITLLAANRSSNYHHTTTTTATTANTTTTSNTDSMDGHTNETEEEDEEEADDDDTSNPHIDDLITIMKAHKVIGDQVQIPQDDDDDYQDILPNNPPFRFTFESRQSAPSDTIPQQHPQQQQDSRQQPQLQQQSSQDAGFHFSFSASSSSSSAEPFDLVHKTSQRSAIPSGIPSGIPNGIPNGISDGIARHTRPVSESSPADKSNMSDRSPPRRRDLKQTNNASSSFSSSSSSSSCSSSSSSSSYLAHTNDDTTQPIGAATNTITASSLPTTSAPSTLTATRAAAAAAADTTSSSAVEHQRLERDEDDYDDYGNAEVSRYHHRDDDDHHHQHNNQQQQQQYIASSQPHVMLNSGERPLLSHPTAAATTSIPTDDRPRFIQVQHRKILPMPKPRWKRKDIRIAAGDINPSAAVPHANLFGLPPDKVPPFAPYMWQFSPPARELHDQPQQPQQQQQQQQPQRHDLPPDPMADMDWGMHHLSLANDDKFTALAPATATTAAATPNHAPPATAVPSSSITTSNTTTAKRTQRVDDSRRKLPDDRPHVPESSFDFPINSDEYERLQHLPKVEDLQRAQPSLELTNVLRDTMLPTRQEAVSLAAAAATANMFATMPPPPPPPPEETQTQLPSTSNAKKKGSSEEKPPSRKTKKSNRKKKAAEDEHGPSAVHSSDLSLIRSPDPEEWICIFCQYQIFCRGLEMARRKGGYYRRKRERQRRLREVEARRTGETLSGDCASDVEDMDNAAIPVAPPLPSLPSTAASASAAAASAASAAVAAGISGVHHPGSSSAAAVAAAAATTAGMDSSRGVRRGNHAA